MKRFFLAVMALLTLTACKIEDGYIPAKDRAKDLIWDMVSRRISEAKSYADYAIVAEAAMSDSGEKFALVRSALISSLTEVTVEADRVIFTNNGVPKIVVTTAGKRLSEGGEWKLQYVSNGVVQSPVATFTGVEGRSDLFTQEYVGRQMRAMVTTHKYLVSTTPTRAIYLDMWGSGSFNGAEDYTLEFTIGEENPLCYDEYNYNSYQSGEVEIAYKDLVTGDTREFSVVYSNQNREYK